MHHAPHNNAAKANRIASHTSTPAPMTSPVTPPVSLASTCGTPSARTTPTSPRTAPEAPNPQYSSAAEEPTTTAATSTSRQCRRAHDRAAQTAGPGGRSEPRRARRAQPGEGRYQQDGHFGCPARIEATLAVSTSATITTPVAPNAPVWLSAMIARRSWGVDPPTARPCSRPGRPSEASGSHPPTWRRRARRQPGSPARPSRRTPARGPRPIRTNPEPGRRRETMQRLRSAPPRANVVAVGTAVSSDRASDASRSGLLLGSTTIGCLAHARFRTWPCPRSCDRRRR